MTNTIESMLVNKGIEGAVVTDLTASFPGREGNTFDIAVPSTSKSEWVEFYQFIHRADESLEGHVDTAVQNIKGNLAS